MTEEQIAHIVNRFLSWELPIDFAPDNGISCRRPAYDPILNWKPTGTNLFTYYQAEQMVRAMLKDLP